MTGAEGQLGTAVRGVLGTRAIGLTRQDLDLTDLARIPSVLDGLNASGLINCAAYTDVDGAEENEDLAMAMNGAAVGAMAEWAADRGRQFLTFSTDYVFDGVASSPYTESSPTGPVNAYGRSKRAGELVALAAGGLVVRTSWLLSGSHPNFVATIIRAARERPVQVVTDQIGSPSIANDVASKSWEALQSGATGLLHVTNEGSASWFDLAREALALAHIAPEQLTACKSSDFPSVASRPSYSVMASERLDELGLSPLPRWTESLGSVVEDICREA